MRLKRLEDATAPLFTMGQAAEMLGLHPSFLRRLDSFGIVSPGRSGGGQRRYSREEIETVGHAVDLMGEGLTLAGVWRVLELQAEISRLRRQIAEMSQAAQPVDRKAIA